MATKNKAGNDTSSSRRQDGLGTIVEKHNRMMMITAGAGFAVAIAASLIFYQLGKSDAVGEAKNKGYEDGIVQGLRTVEKGSVTDIEKKFAKILRDAEKAAEQRGFEKGFAEGERAGLEKAKKLDGGS